MTLKEQLQECVDEMSAALEKMKALTAQIKMPKIIVCPMCGSDSIQHSHYSKTTTREGVEYFKCNGCGLTFSK